MKTIIKSVFLVAILALVITGCQKEGDDLNVSLKSTIAFTGGIYISPWQSGDAEFECAQAGGCDGGSYKMDQGVYAGSSFNGGGVTVTGISKQEFSWSSIYPVCKIIVKAGNGAYIFDIGGAQSGSVPYPKDLGVKEKDISHITFCFGPPLVIAVKAQFRSPYDCEEGTCYNWGFGVSTGDIYPFTSCGFQILGVKYFEDGDVIDLVDYNGTKDDILGNMIIDIENEFLNVTLNWTEAGLYFRNIYVYVGPLAGLEPFEGCVEYYNWPYHYYALGLPDNYTFTIDLSVL